MTGGVAEPTDDILVVAEGVTEGVAESTNDIVVVVVTPDRTNSRNNMVAGIAFPSNICK